MYSAFRHVLSRHVLCAEGVFGVVVCHVWFRGFLCEGFSAPPRCYAGRPTSFTRRTSFACAGVCT